MCACGQSVPDDAPELTVGCSAERTPRPGSPADGHRIESGVWCEACPFEEQSTLVAPNDVQIVLDATDSGGAAILFGRDGDFRAMNLATFDASSGWSSPVEIDAWSRSALAAQSGPPFVLSLFGDQLRVRDPSGIEEDVGCSDQRPVFPVAIHADTQSLELVVSQTVDGEHVYLLTRAEEGEPWQIDYLGSFDVVHDAVRDAAGRWVVTGRREDRMAALQGGVVSPVSSGLDGEEPDVTVSLQAVAGESYWAVVAQGDERIDVTLSDGRTTLIPLGKTPKKPFCDGSDPCGGRCVLKDSWVSTASAFTFDRYVFVVFVETSIDWEKNQRLVDADCSEIVVHEASTTELVFARIDVEAGDIARALEVPIPETGAPRVQARRAGDRALFVLSSEFEHGAKLGFVPLSALVP